jgi:hypothetical protein
MWGCVMEIIRVNLSRLRVYAWRFPDAENAHEH